MNIYATLYSDLLSGSAVRVLKHVLEQAYQASHVPMCACEQVSDRMCMTCAAVLLVNQVCYTRENYPGVSIGEHMC